jgi:hypothetical protein
MRADERFPADQTLSLDQLAHHIDANGSGLRVGEALKPSIGSDVRYGWSGRSGPTVDLVCRGDEKRGVSKKTTLHSCCE